MPLSTAGHETGSQKLLFPGYLFSRFQVKDQRTILLIPGVVDLLGIPVATPCDEEEFSALQKAVRSRLPMTILPFVRRIKRFRVIRGPLRDLAGFTLSRQGKRYFAISIGAIRRTLAFNLKDCPVQIIEKDRGLARRRSAVKKSL